jgi:hypothetical protein
MAEDLGERAQRILDILGETNIGAAGGALGLAAVSLLTEVSNSDFENWIKALRDARRHRSTISTACSTFAVSRGFLGLAGRMAVP